MSSRTICGGLRGLYVDGIEKRKSSFIPRDGRHHRYHVRTVNIRQIACYISAMTINID